MRKFSIRPTLTMRGRKFKGLRGWSGKPLHPPLTDVPISAYIMGAIFDVISVVGRNESWSRNFFIASTYLFVAGIGVSLLTMLTGLRDWQLSTTKGTQVRRTANIHAVTMLFVTALAVVDVVLRLNVDDSQNHPTAWILVISIVLAGLVAVGATFGGSLVYEFGFNVENASSSPEWNPSEIDSMPGNIEPVDEDMSPANRLADIEVAVTSKTPDPLSGS